MKNLAVYLVSSLLNQVVCVRCPGQVSNSGHAGPSTDQPLGNIRHISGVDALHKFDEVSSGENPTHFVYILQKKKIMTSMRRL